MRIPRHLPVVVVTLAWLMFIVSFFLPATNRLEMGGTPPGTPLTGWQAFTSSLFVLGAQPLIVIAQPLTLLFLTFPFINLGMLLSPLVALSWERAALLSFLLVPCGALPWIFPKDVTGDFFIGFYVWDASFFVMSAGCILASIHRTQTYEHQIQTLRAGAA
jgi:hypothetical protein